MNGCEIKAGGGFVNFFEVAVGLIFLIGAAFFTVTGVRLWREPDWGPAAQMRKNSPGSYEFLSSLDRARFIGGVALFFVGIAVIDSCVDDLMEPHDPSALRWIGLGSIAGIVVSAAFLVSVLQFNRPSFLIPPHMRRALDKSAQRPGI
jgi:hypothetical protein